MPLPSSLSCHRTTVQVKTHAQVELKKLDDGIDIFEELDTYLREKRCDEDKDCETSYAENEENLQVIPKDDGIDFDETPKKISKKNTAKEKKSTKKEQKKTPKQTTDKVEVDPLFVLSPGTAAKHNAKTPVVSNKSHGKSRAARGHSSVSFTTSSSVTMTASSYRASLPYQHITGSVGFNPVTMTGTLPPSFFHFPLPPLPKISHAPVAPAVQRTEPYNMGTLPSGNFFGLYEAADALLGLSASEIPSSSFDSFASNRG